MHLTMKLRIYLAPWAAYISQDKRNLSSTAFPIGPELAGYPGLSLAPTRCHYPFYLTVISCSRFHVPSIFRASMHPWNATQFSDSIFSWECFPQHIDLPISFSKLSYYLVSMKKPYWGAWVEICDLCFASLALWQILFILSLSSYHNT